MAKYVCSICGYVFDEEAEGIKFADLESSWVCPLCGASKDLFTLEEPAEAYELLEDDAGNLQELSPAAMSALCSNLAKGAEKQYLFDEAKAFTTLAKAYEAKAGVIKDSDFNQVEKILESDLDDYKKANALAKKNNDRGSLRALVWTEKVSRMVDSIMIQYKKEGDSILDGKDIYVCEVCGFIYIGNDLPKVCPVCKVPNFKMHKVGEYHE